MHTATPSFSSPTGCAAVYVRRTRRLCRGGLDSEGGELAEASALLDATAAELRSHWQEEENGLFAVMGHDELSAGHIGPLVREHREPAELLRTVDLSDRVDQGQVRTAVFELHEHMRKEEGGLFPASLIALDGDEWDASMQAWHVAHPGETVIATCRPSELSPAEW